MSMTNFVVGFVVGVLIYDLVSDRKVIRAIVKAIKDISEGFRKTREDIKKSNDEVLKDGFGNNKKD